MSKTAAASPATDKSSSSSQASIAAARKWLAAKGRAMAKQGVRPRDIEVEELTAPIPVLRARIAGNEKPFHERNAGLAMADAAKELGAELADEMKGLPPDMRTLRRRPQALRDLQAEASELLSSMHAIVTRQARGAVMREMARKFGNRGGNNIPELLADARTFLAASADAELVAAFDIAEIDIADLRALEAKLAQVSTADAAREGANEEQLSKIDQLRLQLDAWYMKLSSVAARVYQGDPEGRVAFLRLIPRAARGTKAAGPVVSQPPAQAPSANGNPEANGAAAS